jgi:hypothetical protein
VPFEEIYSWNPPPLDRAPLNINKKKKFPFLCLNILLIFLQKSHFLLSSFFPCSTNIFDLPAKICKQLSRSILGGAIEMTN